MCLISTPGQEQGSPKLKKKSFLPKYKMAARGLVWLQSLWIKKQKFPIFGRLNWSAKSEAILTKNGQVMAIFPILQFFELSYYEPNFLKNALVLQAIAHFWDFILVFFPL